MQLPHDGVLYTSFIHHKGRSNKGSVAMPMIRRHAERAIAGLPYDRRSGAVSVE